MRKKIIIIGIAVIVIILAGAGFYYFRSHQAPAPDLSAFAQCLKDKGAVFYGAFWCPHCQAQKQEFGAAEPLLPYVECSTPDGNSETAACQTAGITGYPTWVFADGSRNEGEMSLPALAAKTGCVLPQ